MSGVDEEWSGWVEFQLSAGFGFGDLVGGLDFVGVWEDMDFSGRGVQLDKALFELV